MVYGSASLGAAFFRLKTSKLYGKIPLKKSLLYVVKLHKTKKNNYETVTKLKKRM